MASPSNMVQDRAKYGSLKRKVKVYWEWRWMVEKAEHEKKKWQAEIFYRPKREVTLQKGKW